MTKLAIFYEDQRAPGSSKYPLHQLVCACLADVLGLPVADIEDVSRAIPAKGDSKLLSKCQTEVPNMRASVIVAVFDADKVHRLLRQPGSTPIQVLREQLDATIGHQHRLTTVLLDRNVETLVNAAAACLKRELPEKKNPLERDKLLGSAAWGERAARDCIRGNVPSFACFIDELAPKVAMLLAQ